MFFYIYQIVNANTQNRDKIRTFLKCISTFKQLFHTNQVSPH